EEAASTRLLVYAATLIKGGYEPLEACRAALVEPLTDDDEIHCQQQYTGPDAC
ncbi:MAG: hypothetical protein GY703_08930, partial [Gammaproteobacteria bacterium]|nr:hypothetical protein [Gammaproteobacteria bacterium]